MPRSNALAKTSLFTLLVVAILIALRPLSASITEKKITNERPAQPAVSNTSNTGDTRELAKRINNLIDQSELAAARWGICVILMSDGSTLYERDADKLFTPASNMKIYTTGVALDLLGADYRWRTSVYATAQPDRAGSVQGDLVLYGRGAPDLQSRATSDGNSSLQKLAEDIYARGVRHVSGNVIGDESYFRGDTLGDGWQWTDLQWYFGAEASGLSVNSNEVAVNFIPSAKPGETSVVRIDDPENFVTVENRMTVAKSGARPTIGVHRGLSDNKVEVWGEFAPGTKGFGARLSVHNPALWAAKLFLKALKNRGITVAGQPIARTSRTPPSERFDPTRATELASVSSAPLSDIVKKTNKESINLYAELILRTLGRERGELVQSPEPIGKERGDDESGLAVLRLWLSRAGISLGGIALHDGSGLSRLDLVTPKSAALLLVSLSKRTAASVFRESLPLSGRDGTLAGRLSTLKDRVSAKTGSLTYDNSLSGYITTSEGKLLAFSIMCNDQTGQLDSIRLIDQVVAVLATFPQAPTQKPQKS